MLTCALDTLINGDGLDCKYNNRPPEIKGIIAAAQTFGTHTDLAVHVLKTVHIQTSTTNTQEGTHKHPVSTVSTCVPPACP